MEMERLNNVVHAQQEQHVLQIKFNLVKVHNISKGVLIHIPKTVLIVQLKENVLDLQQ